MWVGNAMLVILNLPLIGIWIKLLTVPYRFLFPAIMVFCCIGLYTLNNNNFDVFMARRLRRRRLRLLQAGLRAGAAAAGLHPRADDGREPAPRAAAQSRGDWSTFLTRPLSAGLLIAAALMIVVVIAAVDQEQARRGVPGRLTEAAPLARCKPRSRPGLRLRRRLMLRPMANPLTPARPRAAAFAPLRTGVPQAVAGLAGGQHRRCG